MVESRHDQSKRLMPATVVARLIKGSKDGKKYERTEKSAADKKKDAEAKSRKKASDERLPREKEMLRISVHLYFVIVTRQPLPRHHIRNLQSTAMQSNKTWLGQFGTLGTKRRLPPKDFIQRYWNSDFGPLLIVGFETGGRTKHASPS
jgi:hypothetical protein